MRKMLIKKFLLVLISIIDVHISHSTDDLILMIQKSKMKNLLLFDFRNALALNNWFEQSDTVRSQGKSKAVIDLYKTGTKQSAILFTLLNPLPNGACFGGVRTPTQLNLHGYQYISFSCRATGNATTYKIVLRHENLNDEPHPSFEQTFKVEINDSVTVMKMPISLFKPYYRGKKVDGPTLNVKNITMFGIQVAGGVYDDYKQSGLSSFVVDQIWAET